MAKELKNPDRIKHLEFIQDVIRRMNSSSFYIKGWTITLVSAILVISKDNSIGYLLPYLGVPIFWGLDAYYLSQEKKFRKLYELVSNDSKKIKPFSMNVASINSKKTSWFSCLYSITIIPIYMMIILSVLLMNYFR